MPTTRPVDSLWTQGGETVPGFAPLGPPEGDRSADVVVVGAGVAGLSIAQRLHEDGADVLVVDRHAVGAGVTGGSTAKVTALHGTLHATLRREHGPEATAVYAAANAAAVTRTAEVVERLGIPCELTRAPAVNYATTPEGRRHLDEDAGAAVEAGLPVTVTDHTELPFPVTGAEVLADQLHLHPRRFCEGLAAALGPGKVHVGTPALAVEEGGGGCHVRTPTATLHAPQAVVATHAPIVDPRFLAVRCRPARSYALAVEVAGPVPEGLYLGVEEPTRSLRPATVDGRPWLVVGGQGHPVADELDARACLDALEDWARQHFDVRAVGPRWAAHDQVPNDHLPFAGRLEPGGRRWVATGFQKWGFTSSAVAASIVADGLAGTTNPAASLLDPTRLGSNVTTRAVGDFFRVASRFVGDQVATRLGRRHPDLDRLAPGEAAVVQTDAGPTAVHRDDAGTLHAVSATCTHEGCLVRFNRAQGSWDCPCHGSRFDPDGHVLSGPALEDLEPWVG